MLHSRLRAVEGCQYLLSPHRLEVVLTIADNFVARLALDVAIQPSQLVVLFWRIAMAIDLPSEAYTASILLVGRVIQTLLHRESTSPRAIVVRLVLIRSVRLLFGLEMNLSVVEILVQAHARRGCRWFWGVGLEGVRA